jgi:hypothetical protein
VACDVQKGVDGRVKRDHDGVVATAPAQRNQKFFASFFKKEALSSYVLRFYAYVS